VLFQTANYFRFLRDRLGYFERDFRVNGYVSRVDFGMFGHPYFLYHPQDVQAVFQKGRRAHRGALYRLLGGGLFTMETGTAAAGRKAVLQKCFDLQALEPLARRILAITWEALAEAGARGPEPDLLTLTRTITRRVRLAMLLGETHDPAEADRLMQSIGFILEHLDREFHRFLPCPDHWPTPHNLKLQAHIRRARGIIEEHVRRGDAMPHPGLLMSLTRHAGLDPESVVDEAFSLLLAGTETATSMTIWALHFLTLQPELLKLLSTEVRESVDGHSLATNPLEHLPKLHWTTATVQETLRLRPPAWAMIRALEDDLEAMGGKLLPAGSIVWVVPYITHRDPEFWTEPDTFRPQRFLSQAPTPVSRGSYFPFGAGSHRCIAERFALMEAQLVLAALACRFDLQTREETLIPPVPGIALLPRRPPRVTFRRTA
jgi:pentalenene oxygenase